MFETVAGYIIWGTAAIGYIAMLALTERSAARYVKSATPVPARTSVVIVTGAATRIATAAEPAVATPQKSSPRLSPQAL